MKNKGLISYIESSPENLYGDNISSVNIDEIFTWQTNITIIPSQVIMSIKNYYRIKVRRKNKKTIKRMLCLKH